MSDSDNDQDTELTAGEEKNVPLKLSTSLGLGSLLQPLNSSMIGVALVAIGVQFSDPASVTWVLSAFYITSAVSSTVAGALAEMFGPKRVYLIGLGVIAISAVIGGLAGNLPALLLARVLLAVGTGTQYPSAMTIVRRYADKSQARPNSAIVVLTVCSLTVVALGPTLGGLLVGLWGWPSIFWVNLPVAGLAAVLVNRIADKDEPLTELGLRTRLHRLDLGGIALFATAVTTTMLFLLSLTRHTQWWWLVLACVSTAVFVRLEITAAHPFIDVSTIVRNRPLATTIVRSFFSYIGFYLIFLEIPQWLQYARLLTPEQGGIVQLPMAFMGVVATFVAGRVYDRAGTAATLLVGSLGFTIGGIGLVVAVTQRAPWGMIVAVLLVLGIPAGFNNIGNQNLIESSAQPHELGVALGFYRTVQSIGALVATAIIFFAQHHSHSPDMALHVIGAVIVLIATMMNLEVIVRRKTLTA